MSHCCLSGFRWDVEPTGKETALGKNDTYVTGSNKEVAIVIIHDLFGWKSPNPRLLADHYAKEANATVYVPDFLDGEIFNQEDHMSGKIDMKEFLSRFFARHPKELRFPEIESYVNSSKQEHGFRKIGAIGFCWGGWAVFQLGAKGKNLVDCIPTAHPSLITKDGIDAVSVPVQIIAPEHDSELTPEKKAHANTVIPSLNVEYDYQYFPGMSHGFAARCDTSDVKERRALERAKNAAVGWFAHFLHFQK